MAHVQNACVSSKSGCYLWPTNVPQQPTPSAATNNSTTADSWISSFALPIDSLRVFLLAKLKRHREALHSLAIDRGDLAAAESYALRTFTLWLAHTMSSPNFAIGSFSSEIALKSLALPTDPFLTLLNESPIHVQPSSQVTITTGGYQVPAKDALLFVMLLDVALYGPFPTTSRGVGGGDENTEDSKQLSAPGSTPQPPRCPHDLTDLTQPMVQMVHRLLSVHWNKMPPAVVLQLLPDTFPLSQLRPYLMQIDPWLRHRRQQQLTIRQLLKVDHLNVRQQSLSSSIERFSRIDESTLCKLCQKKIGLSAFVRCADESVLHFVCHQQSEKSA